jgi:hypothetical protein
VVADLNLEGMRMWQAEHPDITHFCGAIFLADGGSNESDTYPSQPLSRQELMELEPNLSMAYVESLQKVNPLARD